MKEIPEEEPQDTTHNFEDRNDTPILEVYDKDHKKQTHQLDQ